MSICLKLSIWTLTWSMGIDGVNSITLHWFQWTKNYLDRDIFGLKRTNRTNRSNFCLKDTIWVTILRLQSPNLWLLWLFQLEEKSTSNVGAIWLLGKMLALCLWERKQAACKPCSLVTACSSVRGSRPPAPPVALWPQGDSLNGLTPVIVTVRNILQLSASHDCIEALTSKGDHA